MYKLGILVLACTVLYWYVLVCTGTYWYVLVRTILPNPVQGYRIPDFCNYHAALCAAANGRSVGKPLALKWSSKMKSSVENGAVNQEGQTLTSIIRLELIMHYTYVDHDTPPNKQ